jgi:hypothetical protein
VGAPPKNPMPHEIKFQPQGDNSVIVEYEFGVNFNFALSLILVNSALISSINSNLKKEENHLAYSP